ncbi:MAG: PAS domain S-box protein [Bacillota bacterium]
MENGNNFPDSLGGIMLNSSTKQNNQDFALDELSAARELIQIISETLPVGIWIAGADGKNKYSSKSLLKFTGMTQDEISSNGWSHLIHPDDREQMYEKWKRSIHSGLKWEAEFRMLNADGGYHMVLSKAEPVKDPQGAIINWAGIILDLEERNKAERSRRETEERYRSTLDHMMEGCAILDFNWNYLYVNDINARHAHLKKEEMIGRNMFDLIPGVENSEFIKAYKKCMQERVLQMIDSDFTFHDGSKAWYEVKVQPVPEGIFILSTDITERKLAEESLQKALQQLKFHVENSPLAVIEFNDKYQIIQWSKNAEKIFGWTSDEVLGKTIGEFKWVYEEDAQRVAELSADMLASEKTSNLHTNRNYRKDGSVITCEWYNSALVDPNGKLVSVFSLVLDVTERRQAEESLKQTLDALKRSNADLEQFAYVASHDLQEPLRMISNYTMFLEKYLKNSLDEKTSQFMAFIIEGSKRMHLLIQDLLSYSRITSEKQRFEVTDLNNVIDLVLKDLQILISDSKAQINIQKLPVLCVNPIQMKQLFQNLITNAIKFKGENIPVVNISVEQKGRFFRFCIKDNGIGINPEYFERIFVIFQRLHDRETYQGTGIGLSVCKRIVEHHGGRIWVESEEGNGASFYFTIPK